MKKTTTRGAEYILSASFEFTITDTMVNTATVEQAFAAAAGVFEAVFLPPSSQIVGGDITVIAVSNDTGTATISVGDATSATRYASAVNLKAAARTALTLTGYQNLAGENLRVTLANANGNATAGKVKVTVEYISGKTNEVQTH
jgi:hypothetical protein